MADLILWNSIARRMRSPSDDFLDNSMGILKNYVEQQGFEVEVIDWARTSQWQKMTPRVLARINRYLASVLIGSGNNGGPKNKIGKRLLGALFILNQDLLSAVQKRLQERMIRQLAGYVRDSGCPVVGIKTWYGETYLAARYFAQWVRRLAPEVLIVAGGPHPTTYREAILQDESFDVAVVGEGERALSRMLVLAGQAGGRSELMERIATEAARGRLTNVLYRQNGRVLQSEPEKVNVNNKVMPAYDSLEGKTRVHVVVDSLGCPWGRCNFCTHSRTYDRYSIREPRAVVGEIEEMMKKGIGIFRFSGSSTTLKHALRIAELIEQRRLKIIYSMFARVESGVARGKAYENLVASYRKLLRSGFRAVFLGAESGNETVNELVMNKGIRREDIVATVRAMREASRLEGLPLDIGISLIYPAPTVGIITLEELRKENIGLVEETSPDSVLVSPPAPFPGSTWYNEKDRFGFEFDESFTREMIKYDYVLYKPLFLWPEIRIELDGMGQKEILAECSSLRADLERRGFITEVTDVQFLMMRSAGYEGKQGVAEFKHQTMLSILSCDYRWLNHLQERVNRASMDMASGN